MCQKIHPRSTLLQHRRSTANADGAPVTRIRSSVNPAAVVRSPIFVRAKPACSGTMASSVPTPQIAGAKPISREIMSSTISVSSGPKTTKTQKGPKSSNLHSGSSCDRDVESATLL